MGEEIRNQAFEDYKKGMKYKDIAEKYGVSLSAVKSWAARYWKKIENYRREMATGSKKCYNNFTYPLSIRSRGKKFGSAEEVLCLGM